jgi:hypothetical protein
MTPIVGRSYLVAYRDSAAAPGENLNFVGRFDGAGRWTTETPIVTSRQIVHMVFGIGVTIADEDIIDIAPAGRLDAWRTRRIARQLEELVRRQSG